MLERFRSWFSSSPPVPSKVERLERRLRAVSEQQIKARYDNALWTDDNQRSWWLADYMSAKSANNFQVRRMLRLRSRYEVSNNPYLFGVCTSNADDLIGTGPTLQVLRDSDAENKQIERQWKEWSEEVGLVEKLRTLKLARTVDGEGFLVLKTVDDLENSVKLYPADIEADQVTTPAPSNLEELWIDGLILHPITQRPVAYTVLKHHPGDYFFPNLNPLDYERIKAKHVIHWFVKFRPGQVRGVPAFTTALDLFNELRAFRKAVLAKMQLAANLTAVLESELPPGADTDTPSPMNTAPIDRGMLTTVPGGTKLHQYDTGEAGTSYEMFQEKCLGEACRPLRYPLNLALGTSQKFNFSSARLDHIGYRDGLTVERSECDTVALDGLFRPWADEGARIPKYFPPGVNSWRDIPHEWHWPGFAPLDPVVDANADHSRLSNGTLTWQQFWASRGYDWKQVMRQQGLERKEIERIGLQFGEPVKPSRTEKIVEESDDAEVVQEA